MASKCGVGLSTPPTDEIEHEWPEHRARALVQQGIVQALSRGQISHSNAVVARLVLCKGEPAAVIAKHLGVHRSAIYQHLSKVRKAIAPLLKTIEVSYHD
jgi:GTP-sensing pleiotropic transcriptional regulator CodY